jgi:trehalose/maltose hydrolase-like predicted phosphorylase
MAWTTPRTWVADQLVNASALNLDLRDNLNILKVPIDTATGKIVAIDSTRFASLDGSSIVGIGKLSANNAWSAKNDFNAQSTTRVVLPVGVGKWAT